jgi:Transcriptional regulators
MSQKELLEQLGVRSASLSELIKRMEIGGLVTRRQGTVDKRITNIFLTDAGSRAAREALSALDGVIDALFVNLTDAECRTLSELLDKLAQGLLPEPIVGDAMPPHYHSSSHMHQRHGHREHHRE